MNVEQLLKLSKFLGVSLLDLLRTIDPELEVTNGDLISSKHQFDASNYKDNLLEKYQSMIKDKEEIILLLKEKINRIANN